MAPRNEIPKRRDYFAVCLAALTVSAVIGLGAVAEAGHDDQRSAYSGNVLSSGRASGFVSHATGEIGENLVSTEAEQADEVHFPTNLFSDQPSGSSGNPAVSANGRFVAFTSSANNLVANDNNGSADIYIYDRQNQTTERVSVNSDGVETRSSRLGSVNPAISSGGRFVVFVSDADNLVAGGDSSEPNIFVHDRDSGVTERVSVDLAGNPADNASFCPAISGDGRYVAFASEASNLVPDDTNGVSDVFVYDRQLRVTERASVSSNGSQSAVSNSGCPDISADGDIVVFASRAAQLVFGDTNNSIDVFVRDRMSRQTERVSVDSGGAQTHSNSSSGSPAVSADGRIVAFRSDASNLVPGDSNGTNDIFIHDREQGVTERISVDSAGNQANGASFAPYLSGDGRIVMFQSQANNLLPGDGNGAADIFTHDRQTGVTKRVSLDADSDPVSNLTSSSALSADGNSVVFASFANGVVATDTNDAVDVYLRDVLNASVERISVGNTTVAYSPLGRISNPLLSADGRLVAFDADLDELVEGDTNALRDVYVYDRQTQFFEQVTVSSGGEPANRESFSGAISDDGYLVAFDTDADNLVPDDSNGSADVFVRDRRTSTTQRISVDSAGRQGNASSVRPKLSANGRFVGFLSDADNLVADDENSSRDVFVHDRETGSTERVSVDSNGVPANGDSLERVALSASGRFIAFSSFANNLVGGDTNNIADVFVHDRQTGATQRISVGPAGQQGNGFSYDSAISADGRFVAFSSSASNLVPGDSNELADVFVHDRLTGATKRVSVDPQGNQFNTSSITFLNVAMSADGRLVTFRNRSLRDIEFRVFVYDRLTNRTSLIAVDPNVVLPVVTTDDPAISADGGVIAYQADSLDAKGSRTIAFQVLEDIPVEVDEEPEARFTARSVDGSAPMTLRFDGSASTDDRGIAIYRFDFDDGRGTFSDQSIVEHTYREPGIYNVLLKLIDTDGNIGIARMKVGVALGGNGINGGAGTPVPSFTAIPASGPAPLTVRFDGGASSDDRGIAIYRFDFDDFSGTYSEVFNVEHTYDEPGTYNVALKVIDADGNADFTKIAITVQAPE